MSPEQDDRRGEMCREKQGFKLIELLIVVAIIGILAAIAVPNFMEAQVRAKIAGTKTDLRNFLSAMTQYYLDHSTYHQHIDGALQHAVLTTPIAYLPHSMPDRFQPQKISQHGPSMNTASWGLYHWMPGKTHADIWGKPWWNTDSALWDAQNNQAGIVDGFGPSVTRGGPAYDASNGLRSRGSFYIVVPKGRFSTTL